MSSALRWSLLLGCLGLVALTARSAWDAAACPAPRAALATAGCVLRTPALASAHGEAPREREDLALAAAR